MEVSDIADVIKDKEANRRPVLIGIEGFGGSGKSTIANTLAKLLDNAYIIRIDDFINKANFTDNSWEKAFDRERLEEQVLKPVSECKTISYQKYLWDTDSFSNPINVPSNITYLIVEGISVFHPSIARYYDFKIWIDTPIEVAKARGKARDIGNENEHYWDLWANNDLIYRQKYHPEQAANFILSNE